MAHPKPLILVTIPLTDLLWNILGDYSNGLDKAQITLEIAEALHPYLIGSYLYKIEYEDKNGVPYVKPILWRYPDWLNSQNNWDKAKAYSEKIRVARFIEQTNIDNLTKVLVKKSKLDEAYARQLAGECVRKGNDEVLQFLGLTKIIKKESEL